MKVIWEEKDIQGGRLIRKVDCGVTGLWMMSWRYRSSPEHDDDDRVERATAMPPPAKISDTHRWGLVSLADGMFQMPGTGTKVSLTEHLNTAGHYLPIEVTGLPYDFPTRIPYK